MNIIEETKEAQAFLVAEINKAFDGLLKKLQGDEVESDKKQYETVYPISSNLASFKGKSPIYVIINDKRVIAHTWKNVFKIIILLCNENTSKHRALMELRNKILGRERILLSDSSEGMRRPFQIDKQLYVETQYDTETLLRILLHRILDEVGFDYSNISVAIRNKN